MEGGTYEVIRGRLEKQARILGKRLEDLNLARKQAFGSIETQLKSSQRITTSNNCESRDIVSIGGKFIFGYNVHMGLRSGLGLKDVFAVYEFREEEFHELDLDLIRNSDFERDFLGLYKYYRDTEFAKFSIIGPHLFMKFRTGKSINDFKTFKWLIKDGALVYLDNRSDHELRYPAQHEFEWKRARRDDQRMGRFPHVSIEDRLFVETTGGDLTIKIEDNTDTGSGILSEPVENQDQTLDDAEIAYATIGPIILLRILPYQEKDHRFYLYNENLQEANRIDAIADSCVLLPDDHGLIFPRGYYLISGELKQFDSHLRDMVFEKRIAAPNGEDYLYVFYNRYEGLYILLSYNLIEQKVEAPIVCGGYSIFQDGVLIFFKPEEEPQKHHALQVWQTPYVSPNYQPPAHQESELYKIGNKDVVRCMAECHEVLSLLRRQDPYPNLYLDLVKKTTAINDAYFWLAEPAACNLRETLLELKRTAGNAIEEFDKMNRLKKASAEEVARVTEKAKQLFGQIARAGLTGIEEFVGFLAELRGLRGEVIASGERRYADQEKVAQLEKEALAQTEKLSSGCVSFLLEDAALDPYQQRIEKLEAGVPGIERASAANDLGRELDQAAADLELLIEVVSNLKIEDATETTRIIDRISAIYAILNRARAALKNRGQELGQAEGVAEFNAQMKLIDQGVINYLDICDEPEKCETYLTKLLVQIEELEGKFSEFDEFIGLLTEKREEIYNAFEARRVRLVESRNKRAASLLGAAERILQGIQSRAARFETVSEIHGYFAGDMMIEKVRDIVEQLVQLEDSVKADDVRGRLKTLKEEAVRQLKDKREIFEEGGSLIKLGRHRFSVNVQSLALTVVARDQNQFFHLTGTNFFEEIKEPAFLETRPVWGMETPSEDGEVYRAEFLAYTLLQALEKGEEPGLKANAAMSHEDLTALVRRFMGPRYEEGYSKGVHDQDAALLLERLIAMKKALGLLTHAPEARACAAVFWFAFCPQGAKSGIQASLGGLKAMRSVFPEGAGAGDQGAELRGLIERFLETSRLFDASLAPEASVYLFHQLMAGPSFAVSMEAGEIYRGLVHYLKHRGAHENFESALKDLGKDPARAFALTREWAAAYIAEKHPDSMDFRDEAAALLFCGHYDGHQECKIPISVTIEGLKGDHPILKKGVYRLNYNRFMSKLARFKRESLPAFQHYVSLKKTMTERFTNELRLEEFKPRVLTSFVRNRLLDQVYLPLIGDNLAKQIGAAGDQKRTDRMGLLLLVSPPGYGKTTLMEYVANRLGLIFMKINGPAIGHEATALDPATARHSSAREELAKLNLSLEMGDNIMIYLDDIQHCNPEFLQKFISLCDAQRKIEGVYKGRTKTYDLRGKKVCVVMAGNPYTESGEKFQIPDMLANRADTYNLGDIIGEHATVFEQSYVENSLTSNQVLNRLAAHGQKDVHGLMSIAESGSREGVELEANYAPEEINEFVNVLRKLYRVRDVILRVNQAYIRSAAQEDAYRTEPSFKLQGSYRNMNKISEKVLPVMNEEELENLIFTHYENEAQTLTSGAEANLLKFRELLGVLTEAENARWEEIKTEFQRRQQFFGIESGDKMGKVIAQLSGFGTGLTSIRDTLHKGIEELRDLQALSREAENERIKKPMRTYTALSKPTLEALTRIVESLPQQAAPPEQEADSRQPTAEAGEPLTAREAKFLLRVVRQQFTIMQHWLKPTYEAIRDQDKQVSQLQSAVKASLGTHGLIIDYLKKVLEKLDPPKPRRAQKTARPKPAKD